MTSNICLKLLARIVISDELFLFLHVRVWRAIGKVDGRAQLATEKTDSGRADSETGFILWSAANRLKSLQLCMAAIFLNHTSLHGFVRIL